jgi:hypothetical protein
MPIYDESTLALMEEFLQANEKANALMRTLHELAKSACKDNELLASATKNFNEAHNKSMDIYDKLQEIRLDK